MSLDGVGRTHQTSFYFALFVLQPPKRTFPCRADYSETSMNRLRLSPDALLRRCLAVARLKGSLASTKSAIVAVVIVGLWITIVIFTATKHEFWRDEVRPLSLIRGAVSPLDLIGLTKNEGHPILWYLLLFIGKSAADTPLVLPVTSFIVALAAVVVFLFLAPFPLWIRCLFIFSALPVYEYSVMARNYGISMLLLFVSAVLYQYRAKYPVLLALALALLANTNVHSAMLAFLIAALWTWDTVVKRSAAVQMGKGAFYLSLVIVLTGVLLCAAFAVPKQNTIWTSIRHSVSMHEVAHSIVEAALRPEQTFSRIVPTALPASVAAALLFLAALGLLHRPNLFLAAIGAQIAFGVFFRVVYDGAYRHQGLYLVFLLFLYWLFIGSSNEGTMTRSKYLLFNAGLYVGVLILILGNVAQIKYTVWADISLEASSNKAFAEFLNRSGTYRNAVIVPEPDYLLESLPYYAKNPIYLPREHRYGTTASWTTEAYSHLSLGELLSIARSIKTHSGQPVLVVLGHWNVDNHSPGERKYSFDRVFTWNANEFTDFNRSTALVAEFGSAYTDENYRVYTLR